MNAVEILTLPEAESPLEWNRAYSTLMDLEDSSPLPVVIRVTKDASLVKLREYIDTTKPLLVYSKRRRSKVCAECVQWNKRKAKFVAYGPKLEIPKDYAGWFQLVDSKPSSTPRHHASIEAVSETGCEYFLTRTELVGFSGYRAETGQLELRGEIKLLPGEIINVEACVGRRWRAQDESVTAKSQHETKLLKCKDFHGREVYLPYAHPGVFHAVVDEYNTDDPSVVYQMEDILKEEREFPLVLDMVFGWPPNIPFKFEGYLRLLSTRRPDTFVVRGFGDNDRVFAEIPLNIDWHVESVKNMIKLKESPMFNETIEKCREKVYPFLTGIKTLGIQYKCQDPDVSENDDEPGRLGRRKSSSGSKKVVDFMTTPVDMSGFNPLDVYPPVDLDDNHDTVSESWSLSFRDPQSLPAELQANRDHKDSITSSEEPWLLKKDNPGGKLESVVRIGQKTALYQPDKRESIANENGANTPSPTKELTAAQIKKDLRNQRARARSKREAHC